MAGQERTPFLPTRSDSSGRELGEQGKTMWEKNALLPMMGVSAIHHRTEYQERSPSPGFELRTAQSSSASRSHSATTAWLPKVTGEWFWSEAYCTIIF